MEPYFSRSPWRRVTWRGHDNKKNVRSAIRYAREYNQDLRIFAVGQQDGWVTYTEVPAEQWDAYFAEEG